MRYVTRPLPAVWPNGPRIARDDRRWSPFKATYEQTLELLEVELRHLAAEDPITLEAGYQAHEIRQDGRPRAGARPVDPAVIVSFESTFGPLRYCCDSYWEHHGNLRAIALSLRALRAVDRYGVSRRGQQYEGWALPGRGETSMTTHEAEAFIRSQSNGSGSVSLATAYREAAKHLHADADQGGDPALWAKLQRAKEALGL